MFAFIWIILLNHFTIYKNNHTVEFSYYDLKIEEPTVSSERMKTHVSQD